MVFAGESAVDAVTFELQNPDKEYWVSHDAQLYLLSPRRMPMNQWELQLLLKFLNGQVRRQGSPWEQAEAYLLLCKF
jgi:hypothetical protein